MSGRRARKAGDPETRQVILHAARRRFGDSGFAAATIRRIAADADVDPALVMHYFGSKADLFAAAMELSFSPGRVIASVLGSARREELGETIMRTLMGVWSDPDALAGWLGFLRSAASDEQAAAMLREFVAEVILKPVAGVIGGPDAERRVGLAASQIVGVGVTRYIIRLEPVASASPEDLVSTIGPTLQRYLTGVL